MASQKITAPDPNFEKAFDDLKARGTAASTAVVEGSPTAWFRPTAADVDFDDRESFGLPFSREKLNDRIVEAYSNADDPGTTSDTIAGQVMVETLSLFEREYFDRHTMSRIRAEAAVASRMAGHGDDMGPMALTSVEYVRQLIKGGKI